MSAIRVIRSIKDDVAVAIPPQSIAFGDGLLDYVAEGTPANIPADAIYAAHFDDTGVYRAIVQAPAGFNFTHHWAGWDETTWPYPS